MLDPLVDALREALEENPEFAPGDEADEFHLQEGTTHAAAVDRLRATGGYALIA